MTDRPLFIGIGKHSVTADSAHYLSNSNFAERCTIVWDPGTLVDELVHVANVAPGATAKHQDALAAKKLLGDRNQVIVKFLSHGGDLIVILRHLPRIGHRGISDRFGSFDLNDQTILGFANPTASVGESLIPVGPEIARSCLGSMHTDLAYTALITSDKISPLLTVPNSREVAGGYSHTKYGGFVIFLPPPKGWQRDDDSGVEIRDFFLSHALQLPDLLRKAAGAATDLPPWAMGYRLPAEQEARQRIADHEKAIAESQEAIESQLQSIAAIEPHKRLFTGTDTPFEEAVRDALEALGIKACLGPKGHCDVIGLYNGAILATEAKGLKRGARPGNPNQCLRWITDIRAALSQPPEDRDEIVRKYADILADLGVSLPQSEDDEPTDMPVKGLVVINAHFDTPLMDRVIPAEPAFNDQVKKIVTREQLCAVTGLQLLGMVLASEADESKESRIAQSLFDTVGVHAEFTDWRQFLHRPPPDVADEIDGAPMVEDATD